MNRIDLDEEFKDKLLIGFAQRFLSEGKYIQSVFNTAIFKDEKGRKQSLETIKNYDSVKGFYIELVKNDPHTCMFLLKHNIHYYNRLIER